MDYRKESLKLHEEWRGKIEVTPRVSRRYKRTSVFGLYARRCRTLYGYPCGYG